MSIRKKIIAAIILSVVLLSASAYVLSTQILLTSYRDIEQNHVEENLVRADNALRNNVAELTIKLRDWAQWDDSYHFVEDSNQDFIDANLQSATLVNLEINLLMYTTLSGEMIHKNVVDLESGSEIEHETITAPIIAASTFSELSGPGTAASGIISLPEGPFFIVSLPVVMTSGEGPVRGVISFGRFFDQDKLEQFEELTKLSMTFFPYASGDAPPDVVHAKAALSPSQKYFIEELSPDAIAGYLLLSDWKNEPFGILRIDLPREIYAQGRQTLGLFMGFTAISIALFGLVIIFLLEKLLISRLARLSTEVVSIGATHNLSRTVSEAGRDEIASVAGAINGMIRALAEAQKEESKLREMEKQATEQLKTHVEEIEKINKAMVDRELKMVALKDEIRHLKHEQPER